MTAPDCCVTMAHMMMPQHANPQGNVHGGVVMKFIDDAAAVVAMRHSRSTVVTAAVEQLSFHHPVFIGNLLSLKASLNMTGRTSMEIGVRVEAENPLNGKIVHIASAYLTFVAIDENHQPKSINPWLPDTPESKRRELDARARKKRKNS
ncbi:MAG: acyl-CoA thioesterase [Proteobacteria bacterium]|nr:acyl-CoA thioesterase [Pseudomonadota bacterium]MBU1234684.1 acyl-CoA thioesterase [Pseudomonadota bacterium]MBU1417627.1 acyl-CoA thioesterase [Pseudomonadota bacterium]MBU1456414.1 acyl-CoA thioesterase [Pseudomonadota bacterium]